MEVKRWTALAEFRQWDPDHEHEIEELHEAKREKILRAKFLMHQSVEVFFRAINELTHAVWGKPPSTEQRGLPGFVFASQEDEVPKNLLKHA